MKGTAVFRGAEVPRSGRLALAAAALICAAAAAGCASSGSQPSSPGSTSAAPSPTAPTAPTSSGNVSAVAPPSSPAQAGPLSCATSALRVKLGIGQGYAGGVYEVIDFTNTSGSPCTLYGYPGVSLVSGPPYTQIGLAAKRGATAPVKRITLAPGATANALLQIVDALNFPPATCAPTKATALKVYPPNQTAPVYLPTTSNGCADPVQIMNVSAVQAGSGGSS
jgi:Protein of unknown function (DUF4232)